MRLFLVRHCQPDSPAGMAVEAAGLTGLGLRQAEALGRDLLWRSEQGHASFSRVISSPVRRARETAEAIGRHLNLGVDLNEAFAGAGGAEVRQKLADQPWDDDVAARVAAVRERAWNETLRLVETWEQDVAAIVVSHDTTIGAMICAALRMGDEDVRKFRVDLGSVSIIDFTPRGIRLGLLNETRHLEAIQTPM